MVAPLVLAAGIGAAGSVLGGLAGGKGAKKAAKAAAKSQEKVTSMNNALVQGMYNSNARRLDPYIQGGTRAGNVLMELLLGPAPTVGGAGGAAPPPAAQTTIAPNVLAMQNDGIKGNFARAIQSQHPELYSQYATNLGDGTAGNFAAAVTAGGGAPQYTAPLGATSNTTGQPTSALSAWDQFRNSTNYNWRFGQGQEATAQNFAGTALDSGAQRLAEIEYGQNFASNELGNWMNMLAGQQGVGLNAGAALAGVGMNATNAQMANNQNAANAQGNAALVAGQANQNMWGTIGQGIGQIAGAWGSSYGQPGGAGGSTSPIVTSYSNPAYNGGSAWGY